MRVTFFIVIILLSLQGYSQKNFEGSIMYNNHPAASGDSVMCEVIFGKTQMKTTWWRIIYAEKELRESQIYDFEKDIIYRVKHKNELVQVDSLHKGSAEGELKRTPEKTDIAGHTCYKYIDKKEPAKDDFLRIAIWQSDELLYIIPEKYRNKHTLYASLSGNILFLRLDVILNLSETGGEPEKDQINRIEATEIRPYAVPDSVFSIPASYKIVFEEISVEEVTLEEIKIEEEEAPPPPPPPPPKPPKTKKRKQ